MLEKEAGPRRGCQVSVDSGQQGSETLPQPWFCCVPSLVVSYNPNHLIAVFFFFFTAAEFCRKRQREGRKGQREEEAKRGVREREKDKRDYSLSEAEIYSIKCCQRKFFPFD